MMVFVFIIFGVLLGFLLLAALADVVGFAAFRTEMKNEAISFINARSESKKGPIEEKDLEGLPEPVEKFLRYTQIIGKERIQTVRLRMKGKIRLKPKQKWMALKAEEYYSIDPPSFVWLGRIFPFPPLSVAARDRYCSGKGSMKIKLLSLFTAADEKGIDMDEAALVRYVNEMMWFPTAYLNDNIKWEPVDSRTAKVTIADQGLEVSAVCHFNERGEMVDFVAERYNSESGNKEEWHTPIHEYSEFDGLMIPCKGEALYRRDSGDFSYIRLELIDLSYNKNQTY